jgi:hypothetical protein
MRFTGRVLRANPSKGGDAKLPVFGLEPMIAGLPVRDSLFTTAVMLSWAERLF